MGNDSILPECGGLADYSDTKERKEMTQGRTVSFISGSGSGIPMCRTIPIRGGPIFFRRTCRVEYPCKGSVLSG